MSEQLSTKLLTVIKSHQSFDSKLFQIIELENEIDRAYQLGISTLLPAGMLTGDDLV